MSLRPRAPCEDPRVRKSNGLLESSRLSAVLNAGINRLTFQPPAMPTDGPFDVVVEELSGQKRPAYSIDDELRQYKRTIQKDNTKSSRLNDPYTYTKYRSLIEENYDALLL